MFSVRQKREISEAVQKILRDTNHPKLPAEGEIPFLLHVTGASSMSWADIRNNGAVTVPSINPHNEAMDRTIHAAVHAALGPTSGETDEPWPEDEDDSDGVWPEDYPKIIGLHGPEKCPGGTCDGCDGLHHWYPDFYDGNPGPVGTIEHPAIDAGHVTWHICKHCPAWCEAIDETNAENLGRS